MPRLALILGGACGVWEELAAARALAEPDIIIATNHAGRDLDGPLDHWVSMHAELMPTWTKARADAGRSPAGQLWSANHRPGPMPMRRIQSPGGSSGLLAVFVGLELRVERMILCGIPLDQRAKHFDDPRERPWQEARQYWNAWDRAKPRIADRVRSMSGYTRQWLGHPTAEWLNGLDRGSGAAAA